MKRAPWLAALSLAAVLLVFGASFVMLSKVIGITSPWLVLLLMFYLLALAKVAEPLFVLRMPAGLRPVRRWEREGDAYRRLGVLGFGRLLRHSPLRYLNAAVYLDRGRRDPAAVCVNAEASEASHFWAAVLLMPYVAYAVLEGMWGVAAAFLLAQWVINVYPILHLRYVRGRLERVVRRIDAAQTGGAGTATGRTESG